MPRCRAGLRRSRAALPHPHPRFVVGLACLCTTWRLVAGDDAVPTPADAGKEKPPLTDDVVLLVYRLVSLVVSTIAMDLLKGKVRAVYSWAAGHKLWCSAAVAAGVAIAVGLFLARRDTLCADHHMHQRAFCRHAGRAASAMGVLTDGLLYVLDRCGAVVSYIFEPVVGAALAGMGGGANGVRGGLRSRVSNVLWTSLAFVGRFLFELVSGASVAAAVALAAGVVLVLWWRVWPWVRRWCCSAVSDAEGTVSDAEVDALEAELGQCAADHAALAQAASAIDGTFAALAARLEAEVQRARQAADQAREAGLEKAGHDLAAVKELAAQQRARNKDIQALEQRAAEAAQQSAAEAEALRQMAALAQLTEVLKQRIKVAMGVHSKLAIEHASDDRRYRHHEGELERLGRRDQGLSAHMRSLENLRFWRAHRARAAWLEKCESVSYVCRACVANLVSFRNDLYACWESSWSV